MLHDSLRLVAAPLLIALLVISCGDRERNTDPDVLARVGDEVITPQEFRLNFEFGHGHLRRGASPREDILDFMIREKILALEARSIHLDTTAAIRHTMATLEEELLIERVFEEYVLDNIEVTDEEIREEVNRGAVSVQFRFMPALNEQDAWETYRAVGQKGWEAVLAEKRERFDEIRQFEREMTSPLVDIEEIEPEVLAAIQNLPIATPSEPVLFNDQWVLFEVIDIRRRPVGEFDYESKGESARKAIYNRKAMEGGTAFVAATMSPLDVRTKRAGFDVLHAALWDWYRERTPERNLLYYLEEQRLAASYADLLRSNYGTALVAFGAQSWTVRTFLENFTPGRYALRARDSLAFRAALSNVVGLVVRDKIFLDRAREEQLDQDSAYQRTMALWKDKWMFQEFAGLASSGKEDAEYASVLRSVSDSLRGRHDVWINRTMLDTLMLSISKKNPYMTVHLFKNNSNKMPFPIVDPNWKPQR